MEYCMMLVLDYGRENGAKYILRIAGELDKWLCGKHEQKLKLAESYQFWLMVGSVLTTIQFRDVSDAKIVYATGGIYDRHIENEREIMRHRQELPTVIFSNFFDTMLAEADTQKRMTR